MSKITVLSKFTILCWATFIAILACLKLIDSGLDALWGTPWKGEVPLNKVHARAFPRVSLSCCTFVFPHLPQDPRRQCGLLLLPALEFCRPERSSKRGSTPPGSLLEMQILNSTQTYCIGNSGGGTQESEFWQALEVGLINACEFEKHSCCLISEWRSSFAGTFISAGACSQQILSLKFLTFQLQLERWDGKYIFTTCPSPPKLALLDA